MKAKPRIPTCLKHRAAKALWKELNKRYDLNNPSAFEVATQRCYQEGILVAAQDDIEVNGIIANNNVKGTTYQNPSVGIRHKSLAVIKELNSQLEPYRKEEETEEDW